MSVRQHTAPPRRVRAAGPAALLLLAALLLAACDRRLLEEYDYNHARVRVAVDWDTYFTETPTGMTVMLFDSVGLNPTVSVTNNIRYADFTLGPGTYRAVIFNQSFDEFGSMRFEQTADHQLIAARATNIMTHEYGDWDRGTVYMRDPEAIGVATDTFTITPAMLTETITLRPHEPITRNADARPTTRSVPQLTDEGYYLVRDTVFPMTSMLYIYVYIEGMQNLRAVEGSITGMADGFYLSRTDRTATTGTLLLDNWRYTDLSSDSRQGWLVTSIPTFALPLGQTLSGQRPADSNLLTMHFTLRDGSTRDFTFPVGQDIRYREGSGHYVTPLTLELDLELRIDVKLPDVESDGGGGFLVEVDPWDDGGTIDIGF